MLFIQIQENQLDILRYFVFEAEQKIRDIVICVDNLYEQFHNMKPSLC